MACCGAYQLHPLHGDEQATLDALLPTAERIRMLPTHCISEAAELQGFCLTVADSALGSALPFNREMFYGHSLFECQSQNTLINSDVVRLMHRGDNGELRALMREMEARALGHEACFDCAPDNADAVTGLHGALTQVAYARGKRAVDSGRWSPEPPQVVGLYHAMVRGFQKDIRQHKLFIGVSGGCSKCCDDFYNLMLDVGHEWTAREVVESEEAWWLRKACQRSRCMVAKQVADTFGLSIHTQRDVHGYDHTEIGVPTVDTVEFDLVHRNGAVYLHNASCDTTTLQNGLLCQMNPSEGYWLFKGSPRSSSRGTSFGSMFGSGDTCGVFPTRSPCYRLGLGSPSFVHCLDTALVSRLRSPPRAKGATATVYQCFDEAFMRNLESMGWNRDHGVVELVPIAVCAM